MMKKQHTFPEDFEALMLRKSWRALSADERTALEGYVSGEEEYQQMREVLLMATGGDAADGLVMPPSRKAALMDLFDQEGIAGGTGQQMAGRRVPIRRRLWLTGAAAAAALLMVASVWWMVSLDREVITPDHPELASKLPEKPETGFSSADEELVASADQGQQQEASKTRQEFTVESPESGHYPITERMMETKEVTVENQEVWKKALAGGAATDSILQTDVIAFSLNQASQADMFQDRMTVKTVASARTAPGVNPKMQQKQFAARSRAISEDEVLIGFLFACP
ncbi:MAG: hypothetical protein R6V49_00025 [Bacteroidales bacterium]